MARIQGRVQHTTPQIFTPLVVDLDGTLLRSDLLMETAMTFIRSHPLQIFKLFGWLLKGKAALKEGLALNTQIDVTVLPYDPQVIELIEAERAKGRMIVLATASHDSLAKRIAEHLQLFDLVVASNADRNLSAHKKRDLLVGHYGQNGFDYLGNSMDDLPIWDAAREAIVVNPLTGVEKKAKAQGNVKNVIHSNTSSLRDWRKALRMHQWMKNALIFVPLLAAHQFGRADLLLNGVLAFLFFGLCASSVYVLNDLLDLADDRHHKTKCKRPFASGKLSIKAGLVVVPLLLIAAFGGGRLAVALAILCRPGGLLRAHPGVFIKPETPDGAGRDRPGDALHRPDSGRCSRIQFASDLLDSGFLDVHVPQPGAGQTLRRTA